MKVNKMQFDIMKNLYSKHCEDNEPLKFCTV